MTFGSLFSGVGGFDLGLERAGLTCSWQVEIDPYCRRVLRKHWPDVPRFKDVRGFPGRRTGLEVDLICGGFPCQDVSQVGKGAGLEGDNSGLWREFSRVIRSLRPRYVLIENVPGLLGNGFAEVLGDLDQGGFDAEWDSIPASAFGAPHVRERVWIVAYARGLGLEEPVEGGTEAGDAQRGDRDDPGVGGMRVLRELPLHDPRGTRPRLHVSPGRGLVCKPVSGGKEWSAESPVCRVAHGFPGRVDRMRALGNAIVPVVAEWLGRRVIEADNRKR